MGGRSLFLLSALAFLLCPGPVRAGTLPDSKGFRATVYGKAVSRAGGESAAGVFLEQPLSQTPLSVVGLDDEIESALQKMDNALVMVGGLFTLQNGKLMFYADEVPRPADRNPVSEGGGTALYNASAVGEVYLYGAESGMKFPYLNTDTGAVRLIDAGGTNMGKYAGQRVLVRGMAVSAGEGIVFQASSAEVGGS